VLLEKGTNPRSGSKLISNKAVVIHWTDSDPAQKPKDTRNYWQSHNLNASAHYIVGNDGKAIQTLPTDEQGKHVGAYSSGNHPVGVGNYYSSLKSEVFGASNPNSSTIGIEVVAEDRNTGNFSNESEKTTSKIAATILYNMKMASGDNIEEQKNSIKNGNILLRHGDITDKKCPKGYMNDEDAWESFKDKVVTEYENIYKEKNKKE